MKTPPPTKRRGPLATVPLRPRQPAALERALTRTILIHCAPCGDLHFVKVWAAQCARGCLTTLGLLPPKT